MNKIGLIGLLMGLFLFNTLESCSLKEEENRHILSNRFLTVEINGNNGGGIESIRNNLKNTNLTFGGTSFEDRIYKQSLKGEEKRVEIEYFGKYPYTSKVLKNTDKEVSVEMSAFALSEVFPGLIVRKIYSLKENENALFVEHILDNTSGSAIETGIWSTNWFKVAGTFNERNIFYIPTEDGLKEVIHPSKDIQTGGNWTLNPAGNWKGVTGESSRDGMVVIFENSDITAFLDWSSEESERATFEWMIKQQRIGPGKRYITRYKIMPINECGRIDGVIGNRYSCGIEYQPDKIKQGNSVEVKYNLSGYVKEKIRVKARIKSGENILKESSVTDMEIGQGRACSGILPFQAEKRGVYWAEVEVLEGNRVLGMVQRPITTGDFKAEYKQLSGVEKKPEELFWWGLKKMQSPDWQNIKLTAYRINPAMRKTAAAENMLPLGDFEETDAKKYAEEKWNLRLEKGSVLTDKEAHSGKRSLKIQVGLKTPLCKVESGKEYKVTFWAKANNAGGGKYVLNHSYYFYKGSKNKPEYISRVFHIIKTRTFDWKEIEKIVVVPEGAEWLSFNATTQTTEGDVYIDDIRIVPAVMSDKDERKDRAHHFYPDMDIYFNVSEENVTPHVRWAKPSVKGKTKVLYLAYMDRQDNTNKRDVVELNQRADIDYKFIPLLDRRKGDRITARGEIEPYILDVLNEELKKNWEVVVVNRLNFKGVQEQLADELLEAVQEKGKGLVLIGCSNLPEVLTKAAKNSEKVKIPENFYCMPEVNEKLKVENQMPRILTIEKLGKGMLAKINERYGTYPCVPAAADEKYPDFYGREVPYWEYKMFPIIKSIIYTSGRESGVSINGMAYRENLLETKMESNTEVNGYLNIKFNDIYGQAEKEEKYPVKLVSGNNELQFPLPILSGGKHIADYILTDNKGRVYDFGSHAFETPLVSKVTEMSFSRPYYKKAEEIKAQVKLEGVKEGTLLNWYVEDTYERIIKRGRAELKAGEAKTDISFRIEYPLTILYRLFVRLEKDNKVLDKKMGEFSMPFNIPEEDELVGYGWFAYQGAHAYKAWRENGFGSIVNVTYRNGVSGVFDQLCNVNMRPCLYGELYRAGNADPEGKYRGDRPTPGHNIRKPCFSSPEWWENMKEALAEDLNHRMVYYGVKDHPVGDECFLGADVCFSEWCLKDFREYLKKQYGDLTSLNKVWQTDYKNWEEVMPLERKDVKEENLSRWLDHKMFMTTVFARIRERIKNLNEEQNPDMKIRVGGTGMQNPGYSYNWWELMKHIEFIRHYAGIQVDIIRSFRKPGARHGQAVGYEPVYIDCENYRRYYVWRGLFNDANCFMLYYSGYALLGDLSFARNTKYVIDELNKANKGLDKMILSSDMVYDIGFHYSQSSLFASLATVGKTYWAGALDSWSDIIKDLGLNYRFVSYEQLETEKLNKNRYKVFVLPLSLCLSEKEVETLREYVETGGILISDYGAGLYDGHGKKAENKKLLEIFGVSRGKDSKIKYSGDGVKITGDKGAGLKERELRLRCGESELNLTTGKAYGRSGDNGVPAVIINRFGKGKAILLNCVVSDYAQVSVEGVGGELSETKRGDKEVSEQIRGLLRDIMSGSGVEPDILIKTDKGEDFQPAVKTSEWKNGDTYYIGLLNIPKGASRKIEPSDATPVNILFRKDGHIYDTTEGKYLGYISGNKEVKATLLPGIAKIYGVFQYKIEQINANTEKNSYAPGDTIKIFVNLKTSGKEVGNHVIYTEVVGTDGKIRDFYAQKIHVRQGKGVVEIPTAFNDEKGNWTVILKEAASGLTTKLNIKMAPLLSD